MAKGKLIATFTAFAVVLSGMALAQSQVSADESKPTIYATEVSANAGETAYVSVGLENNTGIVSAQINVEYDKDVVELVGVKDSGVFDNQWHNNDTSKNPYTLSWGSDTAKENITFNGEIALLEFKVLDSAKKGTVCPIKITFDEENIYDFDLQNVVFETVDGSITVANSGSVSNDKTPNTGSYTSLWTLSTLLLAVGITVAAGNYKTKMKKAK